MSIEELLAYLRNQPDLQGTPTAPMIPGTSELQALIRAMGQNSDTMYSNTPKLPASLDSLFTNGKYFDIEQFKRIQRLKRDGKIEWHM